MSNASGRLTGSREPSPETVSALPGFDPGRRPPALMMGDVMLVGEEELGRKGVWRHHKRLPKWFIPDDWTVWPVLAYDKRELHIIAVSSARKGALKRLITGAQEAGLTPVVVDPFAQMLAIMRRWGWQQTIVGEGWDERDEWRAASCDTQPKAGDVQQAPLVSGAVRDSADAPRTQP